MKRHRRADNNAALIDASASGHVAVVDRLLAAGAAVDKVNNNQRSKPQRQKMSAARRQGAGLLSLLLLGSPLCRLARRRTRMGSQ